MNKETIVLKLKNYKLFSELFNSKDGLNQFKRYLITGFLSFGLEYTIFRILNDIIFLKYHPIGYKIANNFSKTLLSNSISEYTYRYLLANTLVYVVIFWFNFTLNKIWSFNSKGNLSKQLNMYAVLFVLNLFATNSLLYLFSNVFAISPSISKVLVMGSVVSWNFIIYKKLIYK